MVDNIDKETEIDSADDLFLEEAGPSAAIDDGAAGVEGDLDDRGLIEEEEKEEPAPGILAYYGIPAVGAVLILTLGWTFAFIARLGLTPPAKPSEIAKLKLSRNRIPERRASLFGSGVAGKMFGEVAVPISHPFFIPLEGRLRGTKGGKRAQPTVFLNLSMNVLVSSRAAASEFNSKRALIREEIFLHYNRLSPEELETAESRERIRQKLIEKISKRIVQGEVRGILFQEFFTR